MQQSASAPGTDRISTPGPRLVTTARVFAAGVLLAVLAGCSATRVMYNQLDWLIVWYLDDYFSLSEPQRDALRDAVDRNLEWHRKEQLPKYAEFCRRLKNESAEGVTVAMLERRYDELIAYWDELLSRGLPDMAQFLLTLDESQIDDFAERVERANAELVDKYSGDTYSRRTRQRKRAVIKITERFVGRLNQNQKGIIDQYIGTLHDNSQEWMAGRRLWQIEFMNLLRARPADFEARLADLMLDPNQFDSSDYRRKVDENRRIILDLYEVLLYSLTEDQRDTFNKRLDRYARDFELLAAQEVR